MGNIALQLKHENWAFSHGYSDEIQIALVADFLNGIYNAIKKKEFSFAKLPQGIQLSLETRMSFYNAGYEFGRVKHSIAESDILNRLNYLLRELRSKIQSSLKEDSILNSTGDCRGACAYNTGDRSEYLHYGW